MDFPGGPYSKESTCNAGDLGSILGLGRSSGEKRGPVFLGFYGGSFGEKIPLQCGRPGFDPLEKGTATHSSLYPALFCTSKPNLPVIPDIFRLPSFAFQLPMMMLEKEMATHSSILAWRIPWTEEPGRLQSMGLQSRTRLSEFQSLHSL